MITRNKNYQLRTLANVIVKVVTVPPPKKKNWQIAFPYYYKAIIVW